MRRLSNKALFALIAGVAFLYGILYWVFRLDLL